MIIKGMVLLTWLSSCNVVGYSQTQMVTIVGTGVMTVRVGVLMRSCIVLIMVMGCLPPRPASLWPSLPIGAGVEMVDVAVVWPLPPGTGAEEGWLPSVLDCQQLAVFEPLTNIDEPADLCRALVVTAVRLDPCARDDLSSPCRPELRLVMQPVFDGVARDASIHVFMSISEDDLMHGIAEMMSLRDATTAIGPLREHPLLGTAVGRMKVMGVMGDLVSRAAIEQFTQITVHGGGAAWTFEVREFADGRPSDGDARAQHVLSSSETLMDVSVTPASGIDDFSLLWQDADAQNATAAQRQQAFDRAAGINHPDVHTAGTIDCASCHLATPARAAHVQSLSPSPGAYASVHHNLAPTAVFANPQFIHALAWRGIDLAVNERVVHESARSADVAHDWLTNQGVLR